MKQVDHGALVTMTDYGRVKGYVPFPFFAALVVQVAKELLAYRAKYGRIETDDESTTTPLPKE